MNARIDRRKSLIKAISAIYRHSQAYIGRNVRRYRIGQGQWAFLTQLLFNYDGIAQEELSELLDIDKANTARALKKLEDEGYVRREDDPDDARKKLVFVTEQSRAFEEEFHSVFKGLNRILADGFTKEERETARTLLYRMVDNIAAYEKEQRNKKKQAHRTGDEQ